MDIPPSREDQDLGSLIIDEVFSNINEEEEQRGSNSVVTSEGEPSPHEDGHEAIASTRGAFASLQKVPKEKHVIAVVGSKTLKKGGEEKVEQHQSMGSIHPCLFLGGSHTEEGD